MEVIVLGTGYRKSVTNGRFGADLNYRFRNDSNYLIKIGDKTYVFDLGMGAFKHALEYTDMDSSKIDGAFFTHTHNDHVAGLYDLTRDVISNYSSGLRKEKGFEIYSTDVVRKLISFIHGPMYNCSPSSEYSEELFDKAINYVYVDDSASNEFIVGEVTGEEFQKMSPKQIKELKKRDSVFLVKPHRVDHGDNAVVAYGFTFKSLNGYTVGFTGDANYCKGVEDIVSESDYVFIDMARSTKNEPGKIYTHMNYEDVLKLAERYPNKHFIPVHTSDPTYNMARDFAKTHKNIHAIEDDDALEFSDAGLKKGKANDTPEKGNEKI